jgi:hypothetical protein
MFMAAKLTTNLRRRAWRRARAAVAGWAENGQSVICADRIVALSKE